MKTSDLFTEFRNPSIQYRMLPLFRVNDDVVQEEIEWQVRANKRDGGHRPMAAATGAVDDHLAGGYCGRGVYHWSEQSRGAFRFRSGQLVRLAQIVWTCAAASEQVKAPSPMAITDILTDGVNEKLDKVQEQWQAELQNWVSIPMTR